MSNAGKFRKKAVEYEQLKQFDRAVASYVRAIEENEQAGEDVDVALFNKVGDLMLRQGRVTEAVTYYERAVEHYVSGALFDNAIALCNKILRNAPGRSNVYFSLGRICGRKGLRSDATRNFLEYATRMRAEGRVDEGMRALAEVADLMPELTEVGRLVEEHATRAGITLPHRRRTTPANAAPAQPTSNLFGMSKDLVFLDIEYDTPKTLRAETPTTEPSIAITHEQDIANAAGSLPFIADVDDVIALAIVNELSTDVGAVTDARVNKLAVSNDVNDASSLDDFVLFDPNDITDESIAHNEGADVTASPAIVVDGSSILRPYVDPQTPLPLLDDLEPTEHVDTPRYAQAVKAQSALPELLERGVARSRDIDSLKVPTIEMAAGAQSVSINAGAAHAIAARVNGENGVAANTDDVRSVIDNARNAGIHSNEIAVDAESERTNGARDNASDSLHDVWVALDTPASSETVGIELEEHLHSPSAHTARSIPVVPEIGIEPDRTDAVDLHAMLADAEIAVPNIDDLESEEFVAPNNELAANRFVRQDELPAARNIDADDELPPLIFPLPFDAYPFPGGTTLPGIEIEVEHTALFAEPAASAETYEAPAFDASALDDVSLEDTTFEPVQFLPVAFGEDALADDTFDGKTRTSEAFGNETLAEETIDATYATPDVAPESIPRELPFIDSGDAFDIADDLAPDAARAHAEGDILGDDTSDLDDLFIAGDVPTAVVAAEAAVVAFSRRDELRRAVADAPTDWVLRRRLAEALFESDERDAAIAELSAALVGHERGGSLAEAAEIADVLVRVDGDHIGHHQKRVEFAVRLVDQNRLREAYLDLADTLVRRSDDLRANAVYARVLEIDPWDDRARAALGDAAPPPPERIVAGSDDDQIDLAAWLRNDDAEQSTRLRMREPNISGNEQDDFDTLLRHFKDGVARSLGEDDHSSHYDLGVAYKEMGLLDDAIGEFQKALRSRNNRLATYEALGQCFLEQHSYKVAVTVLSRALHEPAMRDEQRVGVLYLLGYSCEALQRFDEARSYFQRVYATDIHFRDIAQRLADLERITR